MVLSKQDIKKTLDVSNIQIRDKKEYKKQIKYSSSIYQQGTKQNKKKYNLEKFSFIILEGLDTIASKTTFDLIIIELAKVKASSLMLQQILSSNEDLNSFKLYI